MFIGAHGLSKLCRMVSWDDTFWVTGFFFALHDIHENAQVCYTFVGT